MSASDDSGARADREVLTRCIDFELGLDRDVAERVVPFAAGVALLTPSRPQVWDANCLLVERRGVEADEIARAADEILGTLEMEHRSVVVRDPDEAERIAPGFRRLGWETNRGLYMALRREPDRPPALAADEVPYEEVIEVQRAILAEDEEIGAEGLEQLLALLPVMPDDASDRWFAARAQGRVVSCCRLMSRGGVGEVEDVATLPDARGRGGARAVVLAAVEASRLAGHDLTFIPARFDDWPWRLYERLGFDPVGVGFSFRLKPAGAA